MITRSAHEKDYAMSYNNSNKILFCICITIDHRDMDGHLQQNTHTKNVVMI